MFIDKIIKRKAGYRKMEKSNYKDKEIMFYKGMKKFSLPRRIGIGMKSEKKK